MTQGPAIRNSGLSRPTSKPQSFMPDEFRLRLRLQAGLRLRRPLLFLAPAPPHEGGEQRMAGARVEVNSGWNWQPTNQGWSGSSTISHRRSSVGDRPAHLEARLRARQ
jgi:hypothetical protein